MILLGFALWAVAVACRPVIALIRAALAALAVFVLVAAALALVVWSLMR
jgi:hypothetical protein